MSAAVASTATPSEPVTPRVWPARAPRPRGELRLLHLERESGALHHHMATALPRLLRAGDLLVVNDAATLPASLAGRVDGQPGEAALELRLIAPLPAGAGRDTGSDGNRGSRWRAVLFGAGDWRTPTERRPPPPAIAPGAELVFGAGAGALRATLLGRDVRSPRLIEVGFHATGAALWSALYRLGRPVQYSYLGAPLDLWMVQTAYAARPWAAEMPSAGRPLDWATLTALGAAGVAVATLTHAAGLSATGDDALDATLPLPERYQVPAATAAAIAATRARGGRVIAVGTSVVRALESASDDAGVHAGEAETALIIGPGHRLRAVDGLYTGLHEPRTSHRALLSAFTAPAHLDRAFAAAAVAGYLGHELGDMQLIL